MKMFVAAALISASFLLPTSILARDRQTAPGVVQSVTVHTPTTTVDVDAISMRAGI